MMPPMPIREQLDARWLTNYAAEEIARIKGLKTDAIAAALGHRPYDEVIHRDNLAVTSN